MEKTFLDKCIEHLEKSKPCRLYPTTEYKKQLEARGWQNPDWLRNLFINPPKDQVIYLNKFIASSDSTELHLSIAPPIDKDGIDQAITVSSKTGVWSTLLCQAFLFEDEVEVVLDQSNNLYTVNQTAQFCTVCGEPTQPLFLFRFCPKCQK